MSLSQANGEHGHSALAVDVRAPIRRPSPGAIREHLDRLLASPRFATSPRCQLMLGYVVEETLKGNGESLKERNIGVEIFKRDPAYDTNADPIVRVAAGEIRKRLAQYYYEAGDQDQVRIDLPTRSYMPVFTLHEPGSAKNRPATHTENAPEEHDGLAADAIQKAPSVAEARRGRRFLKIVLLAACVIVAVCAIVLGWRYAIARSPLETFWAPVLNSPNPVLICTGEYGYMYAQSDIDGSGNPEGSASGVKAKRPYSKGLATILLYDAIALANIAGVLHTEKKSYSIRNMSEISYDDLLKGPVVLIGAFNNRWTMHFIRTMQYQFSQNSDSSQWITDRHNPGARLGMENITQENFGPQEYALVARVFEPETRQPIVIIAGVASAGTRVAGEFVTNPQYLNEFLKTLPKNWQTKNIEAIISTSVVENQPGLPRVVASTVW